MKLYFSSALVVDFLQHYKKQTSVGAFWLKYLKRFHGKIVHFKGVKDKYMYKAQFVN